MPDAEAAAVRPHRRRPRQGPVTRRQILDSSLRLFSDRGYARTSVRDIAQAVGITDAAIYYHFASKRDLLRALFEERGIIAALMDLEALEPSPDPTEQLQSVSLQALRVLARNRDFIKVLLVEALSETEVGEAVEEWRAAVSRWSGAILRILTIYSKRGTIKDLDLEIAAEEIVDCVLGAYLDALLPGSRDVLADGEPSERIKRQVAVAVANAVRRLYC
ncbi:MAG TPA: TetR family transcriptional regulator [Dehalococcoidia bacterium]|nr:TetR family transcriptional regulator [Dehalococcoidia bacterium]